MLNATASVKVFWNIGGIGCVGNFDRPFTYPSYFVKYPSESDTSTVHEGFTLEGIEQLFV